MFSSFCAVQTEGKIYPILRDAITVGSPDFSQVIEKTNFKQEAAIYKELQYTVENVIFHITEIMVISIILIIIIIIYYIIQITTYSINYRCHFSMCFPRGR